MKTEFLMTPAEFADYFISDMPSFIPWAEWVLRNDIRSIASRGRKESGQVFGWWMHSYEEWCQKGRPSAEMAMRDALPKLEADIAEAETWGGAQTWLLTLRAQREVAMEGVKRLEEAALRSSG